MSNNGVTAAMRERVVRQLKKVEQRDGVKVLYACESGSRGWGFASPDSDYDVRFLYVHPPEWYLRVEAPRDVIELPIDDELDVCGWEWRKALGLLKGANPTLIEWLDSPVVLNPISRIGELDAPLRQEIDDLLERKQRAGEAEYGLRRPLLHAFIREELARGETPPVLPDSREGDVRELDRLLYETVMS